MVRFLIYFQYIGTKYSGLARNQSGNGVLDVLQEAIQRVKPVEIQNLTVSCQTDRGVHALCNTIHFDVERPPYQERFIPNVLVRAVNSKLKEEDIRVFRAHMVPNTFHARFSALRRDYLYRLALGCPSHRSIPVFERDRCHAVQEEHLDITKMQEASRLFIGLKDFASFRNLRHDFKDQYTEREMYSISVYHPDCCHDNPLWHHFPVRRMLHVEFSARSYLYRQVRRLVAVLVDVGRGRLTVDDVDGMLRSRDNTNTMGTAPAPAGGLYLKDVVYDERDFRMEEDDEEVDRK